MRDDAQVQRRDWTKKLICRALRQAKYLVFYRGTEMTSCAQQNVGYFGINEIRVNLYLKTPIFDRELDYFMQFKRSMINWHLCCLSCRKEEDASIAIDTTLFRSTKTDSEFFRPQCLEVIHSGSRSSIHLRLGSWWIYLFLKLTDGPYSRAKRHQSEQSFQSLQH